MAVPSDRVDSCDRIVTSLSLCEARLSVAEKGLSPCWTTGLPNLPSLPVSPYPGSSEPASLIACGLLLGVLVALHIVRQAWYAWGGEGAYAFPYDK
jgi:hypothetical protein